MNTSDQMKQQFGKKVRELRKQRGLSQEDFSFECDLDRTYVSQVEQGRRNVSLLNIAAMAEALGVPIAELFSAGSAPTSNTVSWEPVYRMKRGVFINRGFEMIGDNIRISAIKAAKQLQLLPFSLYQSIDLKTLSSIVGAVFAECLASEVNAIVNPIEKGHPDIIPLSGRSASEAELRNYPQGIEIKATVGNVAKGSALQPGTPRISELTGITWQAHHREVESLLGLSIDFIGATHSGKRFPIITGAFFTDDLTVEDWGEISGITGRNTKVTGMRVSGKTKMGQGWVLLIEDTTYITKYSKLLNFAIA